VNTRAHASASVNVEAQRDDATPDVRLLSAWAPPRRS
jgi:hypothetical protein